MLTRLLQSRPDNCGITCVAMIAGVTIPEAIVACRQHIYPDDDQKATLLQMMRGLRFFGYRSRISHSSKRLMDDRPSIMPFQWYYGAYHSVVWDPEQKKFLDPFYDHYSDRFYRRKWRELKHSSGKSEGILVLGKLCTPTFSVVG